MPSDVPGMSMLTRTRLPSKNVRSALSSCAPTGVPSPRNKAAAISTRRDIRSSDPLSARIGGFVRPATCSADGQACQTSARTTQKTKRGLRLRRNFLLEPAANRVEHLAAVVLEHHEVPVAEDALVLQVELLGLHSGLLQERDDGRAVATRPFGDDVDGRNVLEVLQLSRRVGLQLVHRTA